MSTWMRHSQLELTSLKQRPCFHLPLRVSLTLPPTLSPSALSLTDQPASMPLEVCFLCVTEVDSPVSFLWPYRKSPCPNPCAPYAKGQPRGPGLLLASIPKAMHSDPQDSQCVDITHCAWYQNGTQGWAKVGLSWWRHETSMYCCISIYLLSIVLQLCAYLCPRGITTLCFCRDTD